jgi:hypothetical protein
MIHLDSRAGEKEQIIELINTAIDNADLELECLFNNSNNKINYNITYNNFIAILKRFKNHPDYEVKSTPRLAITFPERSKYNDVRILVKGTGAINNFCNNESLDMIQTAVDFETKSRPKIKLNTVTIPNYNIKFNLKLEKNFNNDTSRTHEIMRDLSNELKNYRYKKTFSFIKKSGDFQIDVSIVKSSTNIDRFVIVKDVIDNKLFRFVIPPKENKKGFSVWWKEMEDKPNEKVMVRNASSYYKNLKESEVFTNIPSYEVEVEYINSKKITRNAFKNLETRKAWIQTEFQNFFKQIGSVLQCIQNSCFILSNTEKQEIKKDFIKTILDSTTENMFHLPRETLSLQSSKQKQQAKDTLKAKQTPVQTGGTLTADNELDFSDVRDSRQDESKIISGAQNESGESDGEEDDRVTGITSEGEGDEDGNMQRGGAKKLAELRNMISDNLTRNVFFGPNIVDLSHNNALKIDPNAIPDLGTNTNIHINYLVTDKTDGIRYILYINKDGKTYGIDRENEIISLGIVLPSLANSVLDGELVNRTHEDKVCNNFYIFDTYVYKGECKINLPFLWGKTEGRHHCILEAAKYFSSGTNITQMNPKMPLLIFKKDYYRSDSANEYRKLNLAEGDSPLISQNCYKILNRMNKAYGGFLEEGHMFTYKTDGLVFLPNNLAVFQEYEDDRRVKNPFIQKRWNNNYKWKPADHLTIDFRIVFIKDIATAKQKYEYINMKKYARVKLQSALWQSKGTDNNQLNFYLLNSGLNIQSMPKDFDFFAVDPFIGKYDKEGNFTNYMSDAYFEMDSNDNIICHNGDIISDGQIVECGYNPKTSEDEIMHRWQPHRVRADKMDANNYSTAVTTWGLINNPITKEMLSNITMDTKIESDVAEDGGIKTTKPNALENVNYYTDNLNEEVLTKPVNDFNGYVKRYIINRVMGNFVKPRVLDLGVGKFGDMRKYVEAGVHSFLGIEINYDGLNNRKDGATTRMIERARIEPSFAKLMDRTMLLVGDTTKNIATGDAVRDNINKYYLDVLYGNAKGNTVKLKRLEGMASDGFDVATSMYTIHYMMNSEYELDNFLRNVSENLHDQGYFIGTCLDGMKILKELGSHNEIEGVIDDKTVYFIRKVDSDDEHAYTDITTGNKITVFYEKFGSYYDENLVNMSYLKEKAKEHNLKLIEYRTFLEEPGNLLTQFEATNAKKAKQVQASEAMMTWAKFNAYFIFQKVRSD